MDFFLVLGKAAADEAAHTRRRDDAAARYDLCRQKRRLIEVVKTADVVSRDGDGDDIRLPVKMRREVKLVDAVKAVRRARGTEGDKFSADAQNVRARGGERDFYFRALFYFGTEDEPADLNLYVFIFAVLLGIFCVFFVYSSLTDELFADRRSFEHAVKKRYYDRLNYADDDLLAHARHP